MREKKNRGRGRGREANWSRLPRGPGTPGQAGSHYPEILIRALI